MKAGLLLFAFVAAFEVPLGPHVSQCFAEDLSPQTLMVGNVYTANRNNANEGVLRVVVTDPKGQELFLKEKTVTGRFSFTSLEAGAHMVCIQNAGDSPVTAGLMVRIGTQARDYTSLASTKDLKPSELNLRRVKDTSLLIHKEVQQMKLREEEMRSTNVTIHNRVIAYSLCTLGFLLFLAAVQAVYLRRLLRSKKVL